MSSAVPGPVPTGRVPATPSRPAGAAHLRAVHTADAPAVLSAFASAPDMARQGEVSTLEEARGYCEWLLAPDRRATAVTTDEEGMIGLVAVSIDHEDRLGWFFYWMHAAARGRGWASRAAATVANRALQPEADGGWGLERLELGHRENNPASGAVAGSAGFVHEGTERGKFLIAGTRHDVLTYGRLTTDARPGTPELAWA